MRADALFYYICIPYPVLNFRKDTDKSANKTVTLIQYIIEYGFNIIRNKIR